MASWHELFVNTLKVWFIAVNVLFGMFIYMKILNKIFK